MLTDEEAMELMAEDRSFDIPIKHESKPRLMISLPNGATNGDVIKVLFPNAKVKEIRYFDGTISHYEVDFGEENNRAITTYMSAWWNAPYQRGDI